MTQAQHHLPMLEARDITLKFGGVTALSNISIDIGHQELVALIGPNGAGKSSLLNVLSGFACTTFTAMQTKIRKNATCPACAAARP